MTDTNRLGRRLAGAAATALVLGASLLWAETAPADPSPSKQTVQRFETIDAGGTVRVRNPYGNVYARFGGYENKVELLATIQRLDRDAPQLQLVTSRAGAGLEVGVGLGDETPVRQRDAGRSDRLDLVIYVPEGATFDVETYDGGVAAKGLHADVSVSSIKGDVSLRKIRGRVNAKSERGHVTVTFATGATDQAQTIATVTGEIEAYLWEDADADVRLATSGEISTDFSMQIEHRRHEEPGKHGVAVVGNGGPKLELQSKRGRIRLLRLPKDFVPEE
ncbi:MAG: DUF4097 family beta strand repeat protein [bacterium]|nr:DUF4097 family beta strand repeat protein [bacterium]